LRGARRTTRTESRSDGRGSAGGSRPGARGDVQSRENLLEDRDRLGDLVRGYDERGCEPERGRASGGDEQPGVETGGDDVRGRLLRLDRKQQPGAADGQRVGELCTPLADVGEEVIVDRIDDGAGGGA